MIRPGFLDSESRRDLIELARDGSAAHRLARRADALVLLDKGMSCQSIAEVLLLDGGTIRETVRQALVGNMRNERTVALTQALELYAVYQAKVFACDEQIEAIRKRLKTSAPPPRQQALRCQAKRPPAERTGV